MVTEYDGTIGDDIPETVNGWTYDPDASWNGDTWRNQEENVAVVVFDHGIMFDTSLVRVYDERVGGIEGSIHIDKSPTVTDELSITPVEARNRAVQWMEQTAPSEWSHPLVTEAVFNPPHGFSLNHYYVEAREDIVIYERSQTPASVLSQQIEIEGYRSTGNYTIATQEYGDNIRDGVCRFERVLEEESLETAVDMAHVTAAKLLTTPPPHH